MTTHRFLPLFVLALTACTATPNQQPPADGWHAVALPGKAATSYEPSIKDGRPAVAAAAERSASMWRRLVDVPAADLGDVSFSWWVPAPVEGAHVGETHSEDAAARVLFAFDGDTAGLPARTRMLFDLAEALTGERPPYATLMYVWDSKAPVGSVIVNPRTDRVRKIVVDSGVQQLSRWREHRRNLAADFRLAFGEEPGRLQSVALMTDSDNTGTQARAWYGPVCLAERVPDGPALAASAARQGAAVAAAHTKCKP